MIGEEVTLEITSLGSSGEGVGAIDGFKFFVDGALPSEIVRVKVTEVKKSYGRASLLRVEKSSPERKKPICPVFGVCGGCQLMHLQPRAQLEAKRRRVRESLERIGKLKGVDVDETVPSPSPLHYRNKIQLPLLFNQIGFYKKESHEIIPIDKCYIHSELGEKILKEIRGDLPKNARYLLIRSSLKTSEALILLVTEGKEPLPHIGNGISEVKGLVQNEYLGKRNTILSNRFKTVWGRDFYFEEFLELKLKVGAPAFFQVNLAQAENLFRKALDLAKIEKGKRVFDGFMGVGVLALLAAKRGATVYGSEITAEAVQNAKENALLNNVEATFFEGFAEKIIFQLHDLDLVFLNPPRKGCEPTLLKSLIEKKVPQIIYISCDPATLARDLSIFSESYKIERVIPFDMFPETMHIETLVSLILR